MESLLRRRDGDDNAQHRCKRERMGDATMPEQIAVLNAESEADHVHIWNHRARHPEQQPSPWQLVRREDGTQARRGDGVGE